MVNRVLGGGAISHIDENYASFPKLVCGRFSGRLMARSEELIQELESADFVVIGTPMHNFTVPAA